MEYRLRRAVAQDAAAINELFMEMLRAIYGKADVMGYEEGALDYYFSNGEDWICVAESGGNIVGFLAIEVHREEEHYLYYDDFSVSGAYRGMGIGSALMQEAEVYAAGLRMGGIVLHVEKSNEAARKFYEKRGFRILRDDGTRWCMMKYIES